MMFAIGLSEYYWGKDMEPLSNGYVIAGICFVCFLMIWLVLYSVLRSGNKSD